MYLWSMKIDISVNAKKITLRTMQCATFMTLAIAFMFSMPYIFNGFLLNKENKRLIELLGYMQDSPDKLQPWVWRLHIILLASAIVLSEVFFVADRVVNMSPKRAIKVAAQEK